MTQSITLRIPVDLTKDVLDTFEAKSKTAAFIQAIKKGVEHEESLQQKMAEDYASISNVECGFVLEGQKFAGETGDDDFSEYLTYV